MEKRYRVNTHVAAFSQGDEVILDNDVPEQAGLIRTGFFELIGDQGQTVSPAVVESTPLTITISGVDPEMFALMTGTAPVEPEVADGNEDPGGAGPDLRAERRRQSRRALRRGNDPADPEPGPGAVPEEDRQPG